MIPDPARYYDETYSKVGRTVEAVEAAIYGQPHQQRRRAATLEVLRGLLKPDMDALELGCAGGWWTAELAKVCRSVMAVDVVDWLLDQAPRAANVTYIRLDWNALHFPASTFDLILALSVFEHEPEAVALAARMRGWLRPGGMLVASVPTSEKLQPPEIAFDPAGIVEQKVAGHGSGHVHAFREASFRKLLESAGWKIGMTRGDGVYMLAVAT